MPMVMLVLVVSSHPRQPSFLMCPWRPLMESELHSSPIRLACPCSRAACRITVLLCCASLHNVKLHSRCAWLSDRLCHSGAVSVRCCLLRGWVSLLLLRGVEGPDVDKTWCIFAPCTVALTCWCPVHVIVGGNVAFISMGLLTMMLLLTPVASLEQQVNAGPVSVQLFHLCHRVDLPYISQPCASAISRHVLLSCQSATTGWPHSPATLPVRGCAQPVQDVMGASDAQCCQ